MTAPWRHIAAALLLAGIGLMRPAVSEATKPTAPVVVRARLIEADYAAGTARIEIEAKAVIKADAIDIRCELPPGSAVVPGTGEWGRDGAGEKTLKMRVTLPPNGGKIVVKADLSGKGVHTGVVAGLALPPRSGKAQPKPAGTVIETSKGERLRIHK